MSLPVRSAQSALAALLATGGLAIAGVAARKRRS